MNLHEVKIKRGKISELYLVSAESMTDVEYILTEHLMCDFTIESSKIKKVDNFVNYAKLTYFYEAIFEFETPDGKLLRFTDMLNFNDTASAIDYCSDKETNEDTELVSFKKTKILEYLTKKI